MKFLASHFIRPHPGATPRTPEFRLLKLGVHSSTNAMRQGPKAAFARRTEYFMEHLI